jgi:plastocyanin
MHFRNQISIAFARSVMSPVFSGAIAAASGAWLLAALPASAETAIDVTIKDHRFTPAEIHVPAGQPATLNIKNEDATAEEFESSVLKIEKVIAAGAVGTVRLRPLDPGKYPFVGEYHEDTAKGVVIAE